MEFSPSQEEARIKIRDFLLDGSPKNKLYLLKGSAGTGKSTLISHILKEEEFREKKIVFSATTNKAVSILQTMTADKYQGMEVVYFSIHKLLKIKRKIDKDGKEQFVTNIDRENRNQKKSKSIYYYDIIVIDESSMINRDLMRSLHSVLSKIKGKIVFLGDLAQLPPVNEITSSVFTYEIPQYELREIMRYGGNLVLLANKCRKLVFHHDTKISFRDFKDKYIRTYKNSDLWLQKYLKDIQKILIKENFSLEQLPIFLAYTNYRCDEINKKVRRLLFENIEAKYMSGEIIIFNNFYYRPITGKKYYTSQKMKVLQCVTGTYSLTNFISNLFEIIGKRWTEVQKEIEFPEDLSFTLTDLELDYESKFMKIFNNLTEMELAHQILTLQDGSEIWVLEKQKKDFLDQEIEKVRTQLIKTKKYYLAKYGKPEKIIRNWIMEMMVIVWEQLYHDILDIFADISYGYCITTHKSQGSTFNNIYVDLKNIIKKNSNVEESYRCLYTALTRTSKKVNLLL